VHVKCSSGSSPFNLYEAVKASFTVYCSANVSFPSRIFLPHFQSFVDINGGIERGEKEARFTGSRRSTRSHDFADHRAARRVPSLSDSSSRFKGTAIIHISIVRVTEPRAHRGRNDRSADSRRLIISSSSSLLGFHRVPFLSVFV